MTKRLEIIIEETAKNVVDVKAIFNGHHLRNVFGMNLDANLRENRVKLQGKRFKTNKAGQFFVDPDTKDTAMEDVNLLSYFNDEFRIREKTNSFMSALENICMNIRATSLVNARTLIKERLGEVITDGKGLCNDCT